ncbi:HAMP domain-containing sensor histidine kinase [Methyloceanibacter sp. wino2]|uniref:sensor histidine kinase n=1 Tax=Methyloceanibacter sp. wino2 TaxID=2170729 RepID=UPI000D3E447A|nr:HAMP domain-containing sensor histidine kinase [Methyloceanibacter sp. wino2]
MTDLRLQNRIGQDDREALEHIARALEGRVLSGPASVGEPANVNGETANGSLAAPAATDGSADEQLSTPQLDPAGVEALIEAMPAAIGILKGDALNSLNSAFAYAFGYRSPAELIEAGGLDAILPGGLAELRGHPPREPIGGIAAVSRSRRRLSVTFLLSPLDQGGQVQLLRLVDPSDLEPEPPAPEADTAASAVTTPASQTAETEAPTEPEEPVAVAVAPAIAEPAPTESAPELAPPQPAPSTTVTKDRSDEAETAAAVAAALRERTREAAARQLDFLAKVSHEVRTPLNSIIGFAELMLHERFGPIGNTRYKGYAEDIHQSGLYALSLLNDLLDISKIEAGKFELDFTSVDVAEVVEACVASLQPLAKRTRIVLRTSFADDLPLVLADPRRLRQVLLNLLTNAIKFTREGGQVIVSGTMVGNELRLRVRDSGVGMSENDIAYAMQPFHQLDTSPRHQSGTGLGLPLTKALTDAIRARLELTSEPGVGTSADVIFPKERLFRR